MQKGSLTKAIQILALLFLVIAGLYYGQPFFIPIAFGGVLAMLFLPVIRKKMHSKFFMMFRRYHNST
jgi:predicted PurR-regulated permease PerM